MGDKGLEAFQNSVNVAMCNRVEWKETWSSPAESLVVGFDGETIEMAGDQEELMLAEEFNLSESPRSKSQNVSNGHTHFFEERICKSKDKWLLSG